MLLTVPTGVGWRCVALWMNEERRTPRLAVRCRNHTLCQFSQRVWFVAVPVVAAAPFHRHFQHHRATDNIIVMTADSARFAGGDTFTTIPLARGRAARTVVRASHRHSSANAGPTRHRHMANPLFSLPSHPRHSGACCRLWAWPLSAWPARACVCGARGKGCFWIFSCSLVQKASGGKKKKKRCVVWRIPSSTDDTYMLPNVALSCWIFFYLPISDFLLYSLLLSPYQHGRHAHICIPSVYLHGLVPGSSIMWGLSRREWRHVSEQNRILGTACTFCMAIFALLHSSMGQLA